MIRQLWMRVGARVLCNGAPAEIVSISTVKVDDEEVVRYIDACLDGKTNIECFRPEEVQRDRISREVSHA